MLTLERFKPVMDEEVGVKAIFDQPITPMMSLFSKITSEMAEEAGILTEYAFLVMSADFSTRKGINELLSFIGQTIDQETAIQWSVCYFRNLIGFMNMLESRRHTRMFYYGLRMHEMGTIDDQAAEAKVLSVAIRGFLSNDDEMNFVKVLV